MSQQSSCQGFWPKIWEFSFDSSASKWKCFGKYHHRWDLGLWIWCWNKMTSSLCSLWVHSSGPDGKMEVLRCVKDMVQRKWPEMWIAGTWYLHHVSALANTACWFENSWQRFQFLAFHILFICLTYSLQNFFCSINIKVTLKWRRVQTVEDFIMNVADDLKVT